MSGATDTTPQEMNTEQVVPAWKSRLFSWKVAGAVLAFLVVLGWIFIIVVLILEEKWQLVLVAWLLLYSAAHFCYWYCKRHSLITLHRQIRLRVLTHMRSGESGAKSEDCPPTYDEVMKTEAPPPAYFMVVTETMKPQSSPASSSSSAAPTYVWTTDNKQTMGDSQASVMEYCEQPPEYNSPKHSMSSSMAPAVHGEPLAFTTAAAISAAAAAVSPFRNATAEPVEDPIRGPIVRHLRAATLATLEVSSNEELTTEASAASAPGASTDSGEAFDQVQGPSSRQCTV